MIEHDINARTQRSVAVKDSGNVKIGQTAAKSKNTVPHRRRRFDFCGYPVNLIPTKQIRVDDYLNSHAHTPVLTDGILSISFCPFC